MLSVLDIFRIGIGPSSSHTVGPMRIARRFVRHLERRGLLGDTQRVTVELQGSLALTGAGHGTLTATVLGLAGFKPDQVDPDEAQRALALIEAERQLRKESMLRQRREGRWDGRLASERNPLDTPSLGRLTYTWCLFNGPTSRR